MWQELLNKHAVVVQNDKKECLHNDVVEEADFDVCIDCGQIINLKCTTTNGYVSTGSLIKKSNISSVYACMTDEIDSDIVTLAITIYKITSVTKQYRASFRRAIIGACVHRAAIVLGKPIALKDCARIFNLKSAHEFEKAIFFIAENIEHDEYVIPIYSFNLKEIECIIIEFDISDLQKLSSFISCLAMQNFFHTRSCVCAAIWIYLSIFHVIFPPLSLKEYVERYNINCRKDGIGLKKTTIITIKKRIAEIRQFFLKIIIKRLFCSFIFTHIGNEAYSDDIVVKNAFNHNKVSITSNDGFIYPIDDVDDVLDWNILLSKTWTNGHECIDVPYRLKCIHKDVSVVGFNLKIEIEKLLI